MKFKFIWSLFLPAIVNIIAGILILTNNIVGGLSVGTFVILMMLIAFIAGFFIDNRTRQRGRKK